MTARVARWIFPEIAVRLCPSRRAMSPTIAGDPERFSVPGVFGRPVCRQVKPGPPDSRAIEPCDRHGMRRAVREFDRRQPTILRSDEERGKVQQASPNIVEKQDGTNRGGDLC